MTEVKVKSKKRKKLSLFIADKQIGVLNLKNWSLLNAEVVLADKTTYQIQSKRFWRTLVHVTQGEKILVTYKVNWRGHIISTVLFKRIPSDFVFKRKGWFKGVYVLLDNTGQQLWTIKPEFKWSTLKYDYTIEAPGPIFRDAESDNTLFYFLVAHWANYFMGRKRAAAA